MFLFTGSEFRAYVAITLATVALSACSESAEDKATQSARDAVEAFTGGDEDRLCSLMSDAGQSSLTDAAVEKGGHDARSCPEAARFLLDGTPAAGRNAFDVGGDPVDVDLRPDGARVEWDCCEFALEEVDGDYRVSNANDLALYFEAPGAGAGAGAGSPPAPDAGRLKALVRSNLEEGEQDFRVPFSRSVTEIAVAGTKVTMVAQLEPNDSLVIGACRAATNGGEKVDLEGVTRLEIRTLDGSVQDCAELIEATALP
jgi:hypothetical protein